MSSSSTGYPAPNGWFSNWVSQGQIYPGTNGSNYLKSTLDAQGYWTTLPNPGNDPSNTAALDALMTYFGSGFSADNRVRLLGATDLVTGGKSPWIISADVAQDFKPLMVVYTNDASTSESTFNLLTDISSSGGTQNGQSMPVNVLANMALQIGSFLGARINSARSLGLNPGGTALTAAQINQLRALKNANNVYGDILVTPDGFGSFIKNWSPSLPNVNSGTSMVVGSASEQLTAENGGFKTAGGRYLPGAVTLGGTDYTVQSQLDQYGAVVLKDAGGKDYGDHATVLNLRSSDKLPIRETLQSALQLLYDNRSAYNRLGVVFPDVFYAGDAAFAQFKATLPAFESVSGVTHPSLVNGGDDFTDLIAAQTYLAKLFAGPLNIAHVLNPWGVGNIDAAPWYVSTQSFREDGNLSSGITAAADLRTKIDGVADQLQSKAQALGWFKASPYMDYLALDKYERDEVSGLSNAAQKNTLNRNGWINYAYFGNDVANRLRTGIGSGNAQGSATGDGKNGLLYFQIPAVALPSDQTNKTSFLNGLAGVGADLQSLANNSGADQPHLSFAFDSFFGNPDLSSKANFVAKYPSLAGLQLTSLTSASGTVSLADYLFSTAVNALEDAGSNRDLTKGLLNSATGTATANRDILGNLFGILWGGGNTSTPLSYSTNQWSYDPSAKSGSLQALPYQPNSQGVAVLGQTLNTLSNWARANYMTASTTEVQARSNGLRYAAFQATGSSASFLMSSQGANSESLYLYRLDAATDVDAVTGAVGGVNPGTGAGYFDQVDTRRIMLAQDMPDNQGMTFTASGLEAGAYYGFELVSKTPLNELYAQTSYSGAGLRTVGNGSVSLQGLAGTALLDSTQARSIFFGSATSLQGNQVLGFEDNLVNANCDFDFNDLALAVIAGGRVVV